MSHGRPSRSTLRIGESVALVARRKVAGSRPTKCVVYITVLTGNNKMLRLVSLSITAGPLYKVTGNRLGWTVRCGRPPLLLPNCRKLEFRLSALMDSDLTWVGLNGKSGRQSWCYADAFQRSIISGAIYHFYRAMHFSAKRFQKLKSNMADGRHIGKYKTISNFQTSKWRTDLHRNVMNTIHNCWGGAYLLDHRGDQLLNQSPRSPLVSPLWRYSWCLFFSMALTCGSL